MALPRTTLHFAFLLTLIFCLPVLGLLLAEFSLPPHLLRLPLSTEPGESSISWLIFGLLGTCIIATIAPVIWRYLKHATRTEPPFIPSRKFPWWGWLSLLWVISSWVLAWTRFPWLQTIQPHTFPLLWFGYIVVLNALTFQRIGQCLLLHQTRFLGQLFFLSAGFWWAFEYLNQFVRNWHYVNLPEMSDLEYVLHSSLAFSTVLPAVLSTYEWLNTFPRLTTLFEHWIKIDCILSQQAGWVFLIMGGLGLGLIGLWPTMLFPLLWISPLCLLLGRPLSQKKYMSIQALARGDWRPVILSALAALFCGFWWELWNIYSLSHWEYSIPFVHAFKVFEMPILGYAGYMPFGLTCLLIAEAAIPFKRTIHQ